MKQTYEVPDFDPFTGKIRLTSIEGDLEELPSIVYDAMEFGIILRLGFVHKHCVGVDETTRRRCHFNRKDQVDIPHVAMILNAKYY